MSVIFSFCLIKAILTYMGQSVALTTLDWVAGLRGRFWPFGELFVFLGNS
jgi:hypothetical protein